MKNLKLCIVGDKKEARKTGEIGTHHHLLTYLIIFCVQNACILMVCVQTALLLTLNYQREPCDKTIIVQLMLILTDSVTYDM